MSRFFEFITDSSQVSNSSQVLNDENADNTQGFSSTPLTASSPVIDFINHSSPDIEFIDNQFDESLPGSPKKRESVIMILVQEL